MKERIIKITSGQFWNITFENDQYYLFDLNQNEYQLIADLDDKFLSTHLNLGDIQLYARYVGK